MTCRFFGDCTSVHTHCTHKLLVLLDQTCTHTHTVHITNWFYNDYITLYLFQIKYDSKMLYRFFKTLQL